MSGTGHAVEAAEDGAAGAPDPVQAARVALNWRDLAGRLGIPEIIESAAGVLPGATTSNVVYDLGVAVSLALGDLAEALDSYVDGPAILPVIRTDGAGRVVSTAPEGSGEPGRRRDG